jgi:hypothetical protein
MAARTQPEILQSFQDSVTLTDPTADTQKGPLYSLVGLPLSQVLAPVEEAVDTLEQTYSAAFVKTATDDQAQAFLTNWGESAGTGNPSTVLVYFLKFSRPLVSEVIDIPVGTLIGNADKTLQYITVEAGQIRGDQADSYYNAVRRSYEVALLCQAVANGPQYDLPIGLINTKVSQIAGIDAIENRERASGGIAAESISSQIDRVQNKFLGTAINTASGNESRIRNYNPALVLDVKAVLSSDKILFKRVSYTPAVDYYILGTQPVTVNESYTSLMGGETEITLKNVPSISINSVKINNVPITNFTLISDTSPEYGGSSKAQDKVLILPALMAGDVVVINNTYDSLFSKIQNEIFSAETKLYATDELARAFKEIPLNIEIQGKALPSYDPTVVANSVKEQLQTLLEPGYWQEMFQPNDVLQALKTAVPGLSSPVFLKFQRSTLATSNIETVVLNDNEIATYSSTHVVVTIKNL